MRLALVRLTLRPPGGQGEPYGDDVVALVRGLVETTTLTHKEIGERVGISHMTVCRWRKAGRWRRPPGAARAPGELSRRWPIVVRFDQRGGSAPDAGAGGTRRGRAPGGGDGAAGSRAELDGAAAGEQHAEGVSRGSTTPDVILRNGPQDGGASEAELASVRASRQAARRPSSA